MERLAHCFGLGDVGRGAVKADSNFAGAAHDRVPNLALPQTPKSYAASRRFAQGANATDLAETVSALRARPMRSGLIARVENRLPPRALIEIPAHGLGKPVSKVSSARQPSSRSILEGSMA